MKILVVIPHDKLFGKQGSTERLYGLLSLLEGCEFSYLVPEGSETGELLERYPGYVFHFSEPKIFGRTVPFLADFSRSFKKALRWSQGKRPAEQVIFVFPWGIRAASKIAACPIFCFSIGVERDFAGVTLSHLGLNLFPLRLLLQAFLGYLEGGATRLASRTMTMSEVDAQRLTELYQVAAPKILCLPQPIEAAPRNAVDLTARQEFGLDSNKTLVLFHGTWSHFPNREAIELIRSEIAPRCARTEPQIQFVIAGTDVPKFTESNLVSLGFVPNLDQLVRCVDFGIMPILSGCGVRMKLFDYFKCGVTVISTAKGIEGLPLTDGREYMLSSESGEEFAKRICYLANNPDLRQHMEENTQRYLAEHHTAAKARAVVEEVLGLKGVEKVRQNAG